MKIMFKGFTLIELLVVIAIMAIVGTFSVANFRSFGEDKELANAALDIQSILRTAQTNASANVKCPNGFTPKNWLVNFINSQRIDLDCADSTGGVSSVKSLALGSNIQLGSIVNDSPAVPPPACPKFRDATTTSQDCKNFNAGGITGDKYIKCSDLDSPDIAGRVVSNFNCSDVCGSWGFQINYYDSPTDMTSSSSNVLTVPAACGGAGTSVTLHLWGGSSGGGSCTAPVKFNFAPLTGTFSASSLDCNSSTMEIGVQNAKGSVKLVKVTAGNISIAEGVAASPLPTASSVPSPIPSPSPSPSPAGGSCPGFKYHGVAVSSQICSSQSGLTGGNYYVKCSQVENPQNGGVLDCYFGGCQKQLDYYANSDGTGQVGYFWTGCGVGGNTYQNTLNVIPGM